MKLAILLAMKSFLTWRMRQATQDAVRGFWFTIGTIFLMLECFLVMDCTINVCFYTKKTEAVSAALHQPQRLRHRRKSGWVWA